MQKNEFVDELSGINNELYLKETYKKYINKNPNSHLVIIDMEKFKQINDTYGHNIGDKYLKILANILNISFFDSIVVRLHGDEFAIVTNMDEQQIGKIFELIEQKITLIVDNEQIPVPFRINAGSAYACDNLDCAFEKADLMMYSAKRQGLFYQKFDEKVWNTKIQEKQILDKFFNNLKNGSLSYSKREVFTLDGKETNIFQINTRDENGDILFEKDHYEILRNNRVKYKLDNYNIVFLLENIIHNKKDTSIINIDYTSIIGNNKLLDYLKKLSTINSKFSDNIIISIKMYSSITQNDSIVLLNNINILRKLGFRIKIDKLNEYSNDAIWMHSGASFVGFDNHFIDLAMLDDKANYWLHTKIDMMLNCPNTDITPIITHIDTDRKHNYIKNNFDDNILVTGNYYGKEKKLILKRKNSSKN